MRGILPRAAGAWKTDTAAAVRRGQKPEKNAPGTAPALATFSPFRFSARVPKQVTEGVAVEVESYFVPEQSDAVIDRYVFAYRVRISNGSGTPVQLMRRHWYISEGDGKVREVEGEGVVGEQPIMAPGETHEYTSGAVLQGPVGSMHGSYEMQREDGTVFHASIPKFDLDMPRTLH